ncbi:DotH/IcmK family type IV secretion protein [Burkholderia anthina]|uniref:DotH/IcmK family type IV secretion protein n=1 Tax=Burkholderia anthina TaxID=179879 RepID=UPI001588929E
MRKMLFLAMIAASSMAAHAQYAPAPVQAPQQPQPQIRPTQQPQPTPAQGNGQTRYGYAPQQQQGGPGPAAAGQLDDTIDDVSPPIPVTRDVVRRLVGNSNAQVMTPQEIDSVRTTTSAARRAAVSPYPGNVMPTPVHRSVVYVPDTRRAPETIRLWSGTVSAIVFTDMSGNAWNIESVALNCTMFDDGRSCQSNGGMQGMGQAAATGAGQQSAPTGPAAPTNVLNIQPLTQYGFGNAIVRLQGMSSPIVLVLKTAMDKKNENDMEVDFHVQGRNPSARPEMITLQTLPGFDAHMSDFLYGVPPSGAKSMKVSGGLAEAWLYNDALYVRTNVSILSPAFTDHVGSAEGIEVYKYSYAVPNLLASVNGTPTTLVISGN